jgi:hypothetical protein
VIESPSRRKSTPPFLAISTNPSWRFTQPASRGAGLVASTSWTSAANSRTAARLFMVVSF